MSFLKNLLGGLVKDVVENVTEKVLDGGEKNEPVKSQPASVKPAEQPVPVTATELVLPSIEGSRECNHTTFDAEGDNEYRIEQHYKVAPGFWEFSSGAAEIDVVYSYNPNATSEEDANGWDTNEPYLGIMFDNRAYELIQYYKKNGNVKAGKTLQTIDNDMMKYKSSYSLDDGKYVQYHLYRFGKDVHYHIQAYIPNRCKGTEMEKKVLDALDLMAATYREDRILE